MSSLKLKNFDVEFSYEKPIVLIAGINVLESRDLALKTCEKFKEVCEKEKLPYVFKASFDKANRLIFKREVFAKYCIIMLN